MPLPIRKVKDDMREGQAPDIDLSTLLPFLQLQPFVLVNADNKREKGIINKLWSTATIQDGDRMEIPSDISNQDISLLKAKNLIEADGELVSLTASGVKLLKESILSDETSSFTKQASKEMMAKHSYDFGNEVLVKVKDSDKYGARYISISKSAFRKKKIKPIIIASYDVETRTRNGSQRRLSSYTDNELIQVLHMTKNTIKNASKISLDTGKALPVHRLKYFAEMIMEELNNEKRS